MSVGQFLLFVLLLVLSFLPVLLIFMVVDGVHSSYRNRVWNLRDSLVDDLLVGRIAYGPGARTLLRVFDTYIRRTRRHSYADLLVANRLLRDVDLPSITVQIRSPIVDSDDQQLLMRYFADFVALNQRQLMSGSISGWMAALLAFSRRRVGRVSSAATPVDSSVAAVGSERRDSRSDYEASPAVDPEKGPSWVPTEIVGIPQITPPKRARRKTRMREAATAHQ